MRALSISHQEATALFLDQLEDFTTAAEGLSDLELLSSSRCRGWSRLDVVVHVRIGLEELAGAGAAQTQRVVDHDAASYWSSHPDDRNADPVAHILWLRRTASAYVRPSRAVKHLREVAQTAAQAVRRFPASTIARQS